jgi:hypothetical protein
VSKPIDEIKRAVDQYCAPYKGEDGKLPLVPHILTLLTAEVERLGGQGEAEKCAMLEECRRAQPTTPPTATKEGT